MGKESKIEWTQSTWNPWHGCVKVSAGCKYCYMFRDQERYGRDPSEVLRSKTKFKEPLKWDEPKLIFTCSWSDWFIEAADEWRDEAWAIIKATPQHTYQILTKRPERIAECLPDDWGKGYDNVWLGISAESHKEYNERLPHLLNVNCAVRFISAEPLLDYIELDEILYGNQLYQPLLGHFDLDPGQGPKIDWVIIGGESGNETGKYRYRPCSGEWINEMVADCVKHDVPVFVKQVGTHISQALGFKDRHGGDMDEWPDHFQVRQMPKVYDRGGV